VAGRIKDEDVNAVRERARIDEVVRETVTLKAAGGGSFKGLCPFHDERTPSFHVTPSKNLYHCFSCGEGGDVITYVRKIDALSFTEAVEKLAARYSIQLRYEDGPGSGSTNQGQRARLVEAHNLATKFYQEQLRLPDAQHARTFLTERGFDEASWDLFGVGYSPAGWDGLRSFLKGKGFNEEDLLVSGLLVQGQRGAYDRFRDRVMWPIRDSGGDTIGFGARKLSESDQGPKYLNTPETPIYHKSQVLYGIDLARREMAKQQQAVVVEGYTDVMACHLSGITTAVATCGTAFGPDHVKVLRRILMDDDTKPASVIFTFDGDAAGRKAALKAFGEDQKFGASTFVAIEPHGLDPCDLRLQGGTEAVQGLIAAKVPLFEFVIKSTITEFDLANAEGRVAAMRAVSPILAGIKDPALRPEYTRMVAGWLGMDESALRKETANSKNQNRQSEVAKSPADNRTVAIEREALKCVLQWPSLVGRWFESLEESLFTAPAAIAVYQTCVAAGDPLKFESSQQWVTAVLAAAPSDDIKSHIRALAIEPLPNDNPDEKYIQAVLARILEMDASRRVDQLKANLARAEVDEENDLSDALLTELLSLEAYRRSMRDFAIGDQ
jgi:DNA primase